MLTTSEKVMLVELACTQDFSYNDSAGLAAHRRFRAAISIQFQFDLPAEMGHGD